MTQTITIATTNQGKAKEMRQFFSTLEQVNWQTLNDHKKVAEAEETGTTFVANAQQKAAYYGQKLNTPVIAEDSGLILAAFPEKFGLKTRRELDARDDHDWLDQFLALLRDEDQRRATFYSAIAFYDPYTQQSFVAEGSTSGEITDFPQAPIEAGIPVSSVFLPDGHDEVFAAMTQTEKNQVSHRGKAAAGMLEFLGSLK